MLSALPAAPLSHSIRDSSLKNRSLLHHAATPPLCPLCMSVIQMQFFFPLPSFFPSLFLNSVLRLLVPDTHSVIVSYSCHSFREFSPWCQYGPALIESDHLLPGGCFDKPQSHLIISLIFNVIKPNNTFCVWRYVFITTQMTGRKKKTLLNLFMADVLVCDSCGRTEELHLKKAK